MVNSTCLYGEEYRCHEEGSRQSESTGSGRINKVSHLEHEIGELLERLTYRKKIDCGMWFQRAPPILLGSTW